MVNISALTKLVGSQARVTVGKKQFLTALDDAQPKVKEAISELLSKMKDPKIDIAYKASERGYTVAATTFRDGKKVIGNGALSLTDAGTEHAVVKMRLNIGKNGEVYRYSGYNNMAYSPKIEDIDITTSFKDGIYKQTNKNGNYGFQHQEVNIPKAV
ncbi:hypothetical protein IJD34_02795, partial [bacterium]|nr:hypothetical protein [bacterium]